MNLEQRRRRVLERLGDLEKAAEQQRNVRMSPTLETMLPAAEIVLKHVIKHKRKIYGGMAVNLAILEKSPKDAIYSRTQWPDIDFLTPEPTQDIESICKELLAAGYTKINAHAAVHGATVKVHLQNSILEAADITYCWSRNYNKIPTMVTKEGVHYVSPSFQCIDMYKIFVDPVFSWNKIENNIKRATLIEKLYLLRPFPSLKQQFVSKKLSDKNRELRNKMLDFFDNNSDIVIVDVLAYNCYIKLSKTSKQSAKLVKMGDVSLYVSDPMQLIDDVIAYLGLKKDFAKKVYVPLLEHYQGKVSLDVHGETILTAFSDPFCIPYQDVADAHRRVQIGSYHVVLRMLYIQRFYCATADDYDGVKRCGFMINHLQAAREDWLRRYHKIGTEQTFFRELQAECIGQGFLDPRIIARQVPYHKKFPNYDPASNKINHEYQYPNTSGRLAYTILPDGSKELANRDK